MSEEPKQKPSSQKCQKCPAMVYWAQNQKTMKPAPIDVAVNMLEGNILLFWKDKPDGSGRMKIYRVCTGAALDYARDNNMPLHTNHFMTCPAAKEFKERVAQQKRQAEEKRRNR